MVAAWTSTVRSFVGIQLPFRSQTINISCPSFFTLLSFFFCWSLKSITVSHRRSFSEEEKHLSGTVGLFLAAVVQMQQLLIAPFRLDSSKIGRVAEASRPQTHHPAGREGGRNLKAERPTSTAPFCSLKTCISTVLTTRILQLPSRCPYSTALNDGKAK